MNSVLEIMKATDHVKFERLEDSKLLYLCVREGQCGNLRVDDVFFRFSIPLHDTAGGVFRALDNKPMFYMRWIRKQFEADKAQQEMIAKAKEDWEREQAEKEKG